MTACRPFSTSGHGSKSNKKPVAWPTTIDFGVAKESAKDAGEKGK
jgi:hypothetical protein